MDDDNGVGPFDDFNLETIFEESLKREPHPDGEFNEESFRLMVDSELVDSYNELNKLKSELNSFENGQVDGLLDQIMASAKNSILGPFGLQELNFTDQDGGNVTTHHNFKKGITANEVDKQRHEDWQANLNGSIDRTHHNKTYKQTRKELIKNKHSVEDGYTLNTYTKKGRLRSLGTVRLKNADGTVKYHPAEADHVVSVAEVERNSKAMMSMSKEERATMTANKKNMIMTHKSLNASKGDKDLLEWSKEPSTKDSTKTNAEYFKTDPAKLEQAYNTATSDIKHKTNTALFTKVTKDTAKAGAIAGGKALAGAAIATLAKLVVELLGAAIKAIQKAIKAKESFKAMCKRIEESVKKKLEQIWHKLGDLGETIGKQGISAVASTFVTMLINMVLSTFTNVVKIIRTGFSSICKAVKLLTVGEPGMTTQDACDAAIKVLLTGGIMVASTFGAEAIENALLVSPLAPIVSIPFFNPLTGSMQPVSSVLALAISSTLGGIISTIVVHAFDRFAANRKLAKNFTK